MRPRPTRTIAAWLLLVLLLLAPACGGGGGGGVEEAVSDAASELADDAVDIVDGQANTVADQNIDDISNNIQDALGQARR